MPVEFIKQHIKTIAIAVLIIALAINIFSRGAERAENNKITRPLPLLPPAPKEMCEPEYVLRTDDIFKSGDFKILNLSTFEQFKTKRIDRNRVGYYYRRSGAVKEFYTIFKNEKVSNDFIELKPKK